MQNKFLNILKSEHDAVIITSPENRRYFLGFESSDGYLVITKKEAVFFTDSRYIEAATNQITACKCALLKRVNETIAPYLKELNIKNIYLETERLTVAELNSLKKAFAFSEREVEIAVMVYEGFTNRQISSALSLSEGTVRNYISSIYIKLAVPDRQAAVDKMDGAIKRG